MRARAGACVPRTSSAALRGQVVGDNVVGRRSTPGTD
jgi:hypothetical protein